MEYQIREETHQGVRIIHTSIHGLMSIPMRNRIALETLNAMRARHIQYVLWDIREAILDYSLIGSHMAVLNLKALGVSDQEFIAVLYKNNADQHEHASKVAHNRGIVNIAYFREMDKAIAWLLNQPKLINKENISE